MSAEAIKRAAWAKAYGIGLTGGIATGKSTVAQLLRTEGRVVLDADALARKIVEVGSPTLLELQQEFSPDFFDPSGAMDRKRMREAIFRDSTHKQRLEKILHPAIQEQMWRELEAAQILFKPIYWIYEAALLFETNTYTRFREVWVTDCPVEMQRERLCARDHLSREEADRIIQSQLSRAERCRLATHILDTSGNFDSMQKQVWYALSTI